MLFSDGEAHTGGQIRKWDVGRVELTGHVLERNYVGHFVFVWFSDQALISDSFPIVSAGTTT